MTTEMNLAEAENLVAKLLPEWMDTASSNFAGFAEMLLNDYEDWARDTMECVLMPSEDEFVRIFEAWKLVVDRYFKAMCRPVPSFKTADGVTCYVGDLVHCEDGKKYEVTEANGYIGIKTSMDESDWETFLDTDAGAEAVAWWESRDVRFKISEWEKGVILYVDGVNPNTFHCTCFDFKTWGEYQHLAR